MPDCPLCDNAKPPSVAEVERAVLIVAIRRCHGNQSAAAKVLGLTRDTVRAWLRRYDLTVEDCVNS